MMKSTSLTLAALLALVAGCTTTAPEPVAPKVELRDLTAAEKLLVTSGNTFGFQMLGELVRDRAEQNVVIAPASITMALGMTTNGARNETFDAMRRTLGHGALSQEEINKSYRYLQDLLTGLDPKVTMQIANSIWHDRLFAVDAPFIDANRTYFDAEVRSLDFSAADAPTIINRWVSDKTSGRIPGIVPDPLPPAAVMYLINAIYFKAAWATSFDPARTRDGEFNLADGSITQCRLMNRSGEMMYAEDGTTQIVDLPYGDGAFSMTVVLPGPNVDVNRFAGELTQSKWDQWLGSLHKTDDLVLSLPKFKVEVGYGLVNALRALGMGVAFTTRADFTGINSSLLPGEIYISDVQHKVFVEVNEEGTEAAGVTSVEISRASLPPEMTVDRPFLFAVRERSSGAILFIGKVMRPS